MRRAQSYFGGEKVGQQDVNYNGFSIAARCEDLKEAFPKFGAKNFRTGYEGVRKLWELSYPEHKPYAGISVDSWGKTHDFEAVCERIWACIGAIGMVIALLKQLVILSEKLRPTALRPGSLGGRARFWIDRAGRKSARTRLLARISCYHFLEATGARQAG